MSAPSTPIYRKHGFTIALLLVLVLAATCPEPGVEGGALRSEWTTKLGVWIIFFLQGLSHPGRDLAKGYRPLRLQAFVIVWNYLLFPLVAIAFVVCFGRWLPEGISIGLGLLSILPTTIASAVAFTNLAGGRTASAICATVVSNLLAVISVPVWVAAYLNAGGSVELPLLPLLGKLTLLIVFPMIAGQALRMVVLPVAESAAKWTRPVSSLIILFIVYAAIADSVVAGQFHAFSWLELASLMLATTGLLLLVSGLVWFSSATLKFSPAERLATFFCASQKSLATGLPLATTIFAALPDNVSVQSGALLLPLIVYHPIQLILAALWAERCARN
ncbi:bile acid:sodium symporter [bacterium]|nr:bile acid:sodium symporter [bacterium]